jgi:hypothetical protein
MFLRLWFIVIWALLMPACNRQPDSRSPQVCLKHKCINVEVVYKPDDLMKGLMFRESLAADAGMLFIFKESSPQSFWMKNTLIPLDIVWLDHARRIVYIASDAQPCPSQEACPFIDPEVPALYVLEVNAGIAKKVGMNVGDIAEFKIPEGFIDFAQ